MNVLKNKYFKMIFPLVFILFLLFKNCCYATNKQDLFNKIKMETNSSLVEKGCTIKFSTSFDDKRIIKDITDCIILCNIKDIKLQCDGNYYCITMCNKEIEGNIYINKESLNNLVEIKITSLKDSSNFKNIKNSLEKYIKNIDNDKVIYEYCKLKTSDKSISKTNEGILNILKNCKAKNIETVKLNSGYSTICYTGNYKPIVSNGKAIDFNYSVCRYNSGNYIIIGTPQINITY
ncbi:hypothetical protein FDF74_09545 [Clostridium niameyense]|uniref:TATA-box binding n=1 Tax=Clostridium niameyense TaxID=1622073 RepID=A0A6M0RCB9_9CLOT|nr:YwmB family TATA-box binding protein [Clostridium niameyense]NEZ47437.1 hypothetical protein [Clostridium niameyense]